MFRKNQLLENLINLRNTLSETESFNLNNTLFICSDDALLEMSKKKPDQKSDFLAISGLSDDFIQRYASDFIKVIKEYNNSKIKDVKVSKKAYKVLNNYKDRLTNISRSNRNLYLGKIYKKNSFDLANLSDNEKLLAFLTNPKITDYLIKTTDQQFKHLTTLYRSVTNDYKETGSYNLYITYPYVSTYIKKEKFAIKAPLLYFPVKLTRKRKDFLIVKDLDKDILFNRDLLLASAKFNKYHLKDEMPSFNTFNLDTLNKVVIPFYMESGIKINTKMKTLEVEPFQDVLKEDFLKTKYKDYELNPYLILGRSEVHSSMIQRDMNHILASNKYNELLRGLIEEENLFDDEKDPHYNPVNKKVNEFNINYINDLNDAQEHVIEVLNEEKKLVIWGPPGTGKSQTITSLIADSVLKGLRVLVVSEKKVALDVIYSRLGSTSKYAMFIDDAENKVGFYNKLNSFIDPKPPVRSINNDMHQSESKITEIIKGLEKSANLLYQNVAYEVPLNQLFSKYLLTREVKPELLPKHVYAMFNKHFKDISYTDLIYLENSYKNDNELKDYLDYYMYERKYPVLKHLETKLTRSSKMEFNTFNEEFLFTYEKHRNASFFKRISIKKRFIKKQIEKINYLATKKKHLKAYLKMMFSDLKLHNYYLTNINKINKLKTKHEALNKLNRTYLKMLSDDELTKDINNVHKERKYLFNAYYTGYLEVFKASNQKELHVIDSYEDKIIELKDLMNNKKQIASESFEMELYKSALNFSNSKRIMDIKRIIEQDRKPSVRNFIKTFKPELLENVKIWMATPEVVSTIIPLDNGIFDLVIFDEASQMYVEKGIPAIYRANKVVIAGDPKQLRPSSLGVGRIEDIDEDEILEENLLTDIAIDAKSLLDLARYKYHETILNYHYRSKYEELIAFSNHAFYNNKLIVAPNQKLSAKPPIEYIYVDNATFTKRANLNEAKEVLNLVKKIFRTRKNNETIGIITFNTAQRDLIENLIDEELFKKSTYQKQFEKELYRRENDEDQSLFVKNIENVQGDERDIIIFSMGYAKDSSGRVMRRFGWLNHSGGENRLNVAVTRAKEKIYFVSSLYPEEFKVDDLTSYGPKLLKDFMRYCYFISNQDTAMAKVVLNELHNTEEETSKALSNELLIDIKKRLERNNYKVQMNIGIGSYKIDLAVFDELTKEHLLGINLDINQTNKNMNPRKDLIHQEKYLNSRGWQVHQIFAINWYTDPNREFRKIKNKLKSN